MPKALLVTDSEWVRNDVHAALSLGDWEISDLDDPQRTVEQVSDLEADVVLVDMQVRSMGGMAVIRDIIGVLDEERRPRTVLLLDRSADEFLARRAGADASVIKPFTAHALREAVGG